MQQQQMNAQQQQQQAQAQQAPQDQERVRFIAELEFVQCLANPNYICFLAQNGYFKKPEFINYMEYLKVRFFFIFINFNNYNCSTGRSQNTQN